MLRGTLLISLAVAIAGTGSLKGDAQPAARADGLTAVEIDAWYWGTQGSRMMPKSWFMALEQADSGELFSKEENLAGFGYIPAPPGRSNRLPIGFAIDRQPDERLRVTRLRWYSGQRGDRADTAEPWIGLNCAACHTGELRYQGRSIRIDGGPGMGDFDAFVAAADAALVRTRDDPAKFDRFASRVFAASRVPDTPPNRIALRSAMSSLIDWQQRTAALNRTPLRAGFARVDAFGHIYNKIALFSGAPDPIANPSDAPVSYPFLWNIQRQKKVQWNGAAENARLSLGGRDLLDYGAMGRNTGEVLGVFGEVVVTRPRTLTQRLRGYVSSVNARSLDSLEHVVGRFRAPTWPASFPAIDQAKAATGRKLFEAQCASCHKTPDRQQAGQPTEVMVPFRATKPENLTDIWMACNAYSYDGMTGRLWGVGEDFLAGRPLPERAPLVTMLATTVKGTLLGKKGAIVRTAGGSFLRLRRPPVVFASDEGPLPPEAGKAARRNLCLRTDNPLLAYKARPLDGIWATAPYLHNGSVPTLYDLLLPAPQRPQQFRLGHRDYDPVRVGFERRESGGFQYIALDGAGRPIEGNSNAGHDYGAARLSTADRWALVEYMKTL